MTNLSATTKPKCDCRGTGVANKQPCDGCNRGYWVRRSAEQLRRNHEWDWLHCVELARAYHANPDKQGMALYVPEAKP